MRKANARVMEMGGSRSSKRRFPDAVGVGFRRCASSWLHEALSKHPEVVKPANGLHFFSEEVHRGVDWYLDQLGEPGEEQVVVEFSVSYGYPEHCDGVASAIAEVAPTAKIFAAVRNPVDRAFSDYLRSVRLLEIDRRCSFEDAIARYPAFLERGRYGRLLKPFYDRFGSDGVLVLLYEDLVRDCKGYFAKLCRFLGIEERLDPSLTDPRTEAGGTIGNSMYTGAILRLKRKADYWFSGTRFAGQWRAIKNRNLSIYKRILSLNSRRVSLSDGTRRRLESFFAEDIALLEQIASIDLSEWRRSGRTINAWTGGPARLAGGPVRHRHGEALSHHTERVNLHIYQTPMTHESRVLKETRSIVEQGFADRVVVVALWAPGLEELEPLDPSRIVHRIRPGRLRLPGRSLARAWSLWVWLLRVLCAYWRRRISAVNCHSLLVLPLGVVLKAVHRAKLIYDPHELETEKDGWKGMKRIVGRVIERLFIRRADAVIVVSTSIAEWYRRTYGLDNISVVRNVPVLRKVACSKGEILRTLFDILPSDMLFIFQGNLTRGRGVELLLEVFSDVPEDKHIVFMGFGDLQEKVLAHARRYKTIHFHPAVPSEEIAGYTRCADIGFNLAQAGCLNHLYSLPNKIFEYIASEVPVVVSDFPEMGRFVDQYGCGWRVAVRCDVVRAFVLELDWTRTLAAKARAAECRKLFSWEDEMAVAYRKVYAGEPEKGRRAGRWPAGVFPSNRT